MNKGGTGSIFCLRSTLEPQREYLKLNAVWVCIQFSMMFFLFIQVVSLEVQTQCVILVGLQ